MYYNSQKVKQRSLTFLVMLNLSLKGDSYILNITLPNTKFNDELLNKVVGLTYKTKSGVSSTYMSKNINDIHRLSEKLLTVLKLLDYGTK